MDTLKKFIQSTQVNEKIDINIKKHSPKLNILILSYVIILFTSGIITYYTFEIINNII